MHDVFRSPVCSLEHARWSANGTPSTHLPLAQLLALQDPVQTQPFWRQSTVQTSTPLLEALNYIHRMLLITTPCMSGTPSFAGGECHARACPPWCQGQQTWHGPSLARPAPSIYSSSHCPFNLYRICGFCERGCNAQASCIRGGPSFWHGAAIAHPATPSNIPYGDIFLINKSICHLPTGGCAVLLPILLRPLPLLFVPLLAFRPAQFTLVVCGSHLGRTGSVPVPSTGGTRPFFAPRLFFFCPPSLLAAQCQAPYCGLLWICRAPRANRSAL